MIIYIVFDLGNVILRWDPHYIAGKLSNDKDDQKIIVDELFGSSQWQMLDQGLITVDEVKQQFSSEHYELLSYALDHWHDYFEPFVKMILLVKELKERGYQIYLLSNCSVQFDDYCRRVEAFKYFDDFYLSARHQLLKPDLKIYQDFLSKFDLLAEECIFIDDVLANVEGAQATNMAAYHYDGDVEKLRSCLRNCYNIPINY